MVPEQGCSLSPLQVRDREDATGERQIFTCGNYGLTRPTSSPGKTMEQVIFKRISGHVRQKKETGMDVRHHLAHLLDLWTGEEHGCLLP